MFKIGEFSKITQVSVRMLRYYDEQKLLEPCIIDDSNGYRLYSSKQIEKLNRIIIVRLYFGRNSKRFFKMYQMLINYRASPFITT